MTPTPELAAARPTLSVIIPMFNEAGRIGPTLRDVLATALEFAYDGSAACGRRV
jgi:hypothetical protein